MADKSLAKALKRKMGLDDEILHRTRAVEGGVSLLMNGTRREIFAYVCNVPCSHLRAISRELGLSPQTVGWHLAKLEDGNLVSRIRRGKKHLYFPFGHIMGVNECGVMHALSGGDALRVYRLIHSAEGGTQKDMAEALNIYQQKLSTILLKLEAAGLVAHGKRGREKVYSSTGRAEEVAGGFDGKGPVYRRNLISVFIGDGLGCTEIESDDNEMVFRLDIGAGEHPVFRVYRNPIRALLEGEER